VDRSANQLPGGPIAGGSGSIAEPYSFSGRADSSLRSLANCAGVCPYCLLKARMKWLLSAVAS
jgi:hypothetical protein